jgi:hypothetical protein
MTTDHQQSLRLGQRTPSPTPGVQLVTVATLPDVAYRGQIVYALDIDEFRVYDGDAWQIPTAATSGGLQTFVQATEPVADAVGDLWMKTTNYTLYVWDGTNWQVVQDADAPNRDLFTWRLAKWMVDNGVTASTHVYYIGTDPVLNPDWTVAPFELWFKSDTNQLYNYVSGAWSPITDPATVKIFQDAGYPQAVGFDQRITAYFQTGFPWANGTAGHGQDIGDIWVDTDNANALYGFNGLWTLLTDRPIVQNAIAAANAQSTADAAQTAAASAASSASAANTAALAAQSAADAAQATADGAIRTYYTATAPTGENSTTDVGDLWFNTSNNQASRWNGTSWVLIQDNSIAAALAAAQNAQTTADGKITAYYQTAAPTVAELGDLWYDTDDKNKPYYCSAVGPVVWTAVRDATIADAQSTADAAAAAAAAAQASANNALPDGSPPSSSPVPMSQAGLGFFILKWTPISNHDPVTYEVHVSATDGFTADSTTLVGQTTASQFMVKALPGPPPADGEADPRVLDYDTTYYARIIARDADGAAAQSAEVVATAVRATGIDLAVDSVTADQIVAGTLTGDLFAASVVVAGTFKTADTGQRVEFGTAGIQAYKSDNTKMINLPTDGSQGLIDLEVIARGLTATDGASLSGTSQLTKDATLSLQNGITSPSFTPQVGVTYDTKFITTSTLTSTQKTGPLGTFDLAADEVYCMEWKDFTTDYWVLHQVRLNGTRAWFFRVDTGAPFDIGGGTYFTDYVDWAYYSVWQITASGTGSSKNGVYRMGRWIPSGADNTYYLQSPAGLNRYSRQNGSNAPAIGSDGNDIFVAEVISGSLRVRYFVPTGTGENLASPTSTVESGQGFSSTNGLCTILVGNFDVGTGRYVVAQRGVNFNVQQLNVFGGAFYPGGSGNNWASVNKSAETWESPTTNRRAIAWDGGNSCFWTFGADGFMYKHTSEVWDPAVSSSTYWAKTTFYDSAGTTHETTPGPAKSYNANRRSKNFFSPPALTLGGTDDPDNFRLYMARGTTAPANTSYHLQYTGTASTMWTTMATATAVPPTTNNFPGANPGKITNPAGTLVIDATGAITGVTGTFSGAVSTGALTPSSLNVSGTTTLGTTATKGGNAIAVEGPYYYAWLSSVSNVATGNFGTLTGYTTLGSSGITLSSGNFTLPRTGRYRLYVQAYWGLQVTPVGKRIIQWVRGATILASGTVAPSSLTEVVVSTEVSLIATAGDVVFSQFYHTAGGSSAPTTGRDITFITIDWLGV